MTSAYCKYGFETTYGSGTTSTWYKLYANNVNTDESYTHVNQEYSIARRVLPSKFNTTKTISGSITCALDYATLQRLMRNIMWGSPVGGYYYFFQISDSTINSLVIQIADYTDTANYVTTYSGIIITQLKIAYKIKELSTIEISFIAQSKTVESSESAPDNFTIDNKSFVDYEQKISYDSSYSEVINSSALLITINRTVDENTHIIGSQTPLKFYDSGYMSIAAELTFSENEYSIFSKFSDNLVTTFKCGQNPDDLSIWPYYIEFVNVSLLTLTHSISAAGKVEKRVTFEGNIGTSIKLGAL